MARRISITTLVLAITLYGCLSEIMPVEMPLVVQPPARSPLVTKGKANIEGVYRVVGGGETFGDTLVVKFMNDRLCLFSGLQGILGETAGAMNGDTAAFTGYYRFVRSERRGNITFTFLPAEGGTSLRTNVPCAQAVIRGSYDDNGTRRDLLLTLGRKSTAKTDSVYIIGNCAGGRNSERLGRSENSMEMARFADILGCTGIEADLHVTQDGEVILMHD